MEETVSNVVDKAKKVRLIIAIVSFLASSWLFALIIFIIIIFFILLGGASDDSDSSSSTIASGTTVCSYNVNGKKVSNIKVKLLNCEGNSYVEGEDLIDFEDYITGVVSQEIGESAPTEALKVQAIAARSYSLRRVEEMNGQFGIKLEEDDNGQWILSLRSCTNDQVFCNPDKGCWSNATGGQTQNGKEDKECTVHSGYDSSKTWSRQALSQDSPVRQAVKDTAGQVYTDKDGKIVYTTYTDKNQQEWIKKAKATEDNEGTENDDGKDAFEILVEEYGEGKITEPECETVGTTINNVDINTMINKNQSEAWQTLIGSSSTANHPSVSKQVMDGRVETIKVPVRVWSGSGKNPKTDTTKKEIKITVNKALTGLWTAFFTDVYNEADDFVFDTSDTGYGCYNYRNVTGGSTLSPHAYGVACDLNPSTKGNGYGETSYSKEKWQKLSETRSKYQIIYQGSKIVQIAHKYTLINGSDWNNANDAMHFSFIGDRSRSDAQSCQGKTTCPWKE